MITPFLLHLLVSNERTKFIRDGLVQYLGLEGAVLEPLRGLRILDVGCGGGILAESLARLGASVTGIDISEENIRVAKSHGEADPWISGRLDYRCISAEELLTRGKELLGWGKAPGVVVALQASQM